MRRRLAAGIVTAVTAVAMTVPAAGVADQGGKPHTTPPMCHMHKNKGKHNGQMKNGTKGKRNGASKGNKCGHTTTTTTTATSGTTGTSGNNGKHLGQNGTK